MTLRKAPGGLALGGAYHAVLVQIALAVALGFVALLGALAWTQSGCATDGSILAAFAFSPA